jgi:diacylglycerol kinase (ATP)
MSAQGPKGLERIIKATTYSIKGLVNSFRNEAAFRQELFLVMFMLPFGLWFGETGIEKALLTMVLFIVIIVELLNTGIEAAIDRFGGDHHKLSGYAKDAASAAVFVSLLNVVVVWSLILFL